MSYSTDPVLDASRHLDAQWETTHDRHQAEERAKLSFIADVLGRPMDAPTSTGEQHPVYKTTDGQLTRTHRASTVGEVMLDALDHTDGPSFDELFALVASAANGKNIADDARDFINRLGAVYAFYKVAA